MFTVRVSVNFILFYFSVKLSNFPSFFYEFETERPPGAHCLPIPSLPSLPSYLVFIYLYSLYYKYLHVPNYCHCNISIVIIFNYHFNFLLYNNHTLIYKKKGKFIL